jgi:hypothetical protein
MSPTEADPGSCSLIEQVRAADCKLHAKAVARPEACLAVKGDGLIQTGRVSGDKTVGIPVPYETPRANEGAGKGRCRRYQAPVENEYERLAPMPNWFSDPKRFTIGLSAASPTSRL